MHYTLSFQKGLPQFFLSFDAFHQNSSIKSQVFEN
jgi:hypothetical protein